MKYIILAFQFLETWLNARKITREKVTELEDQLVTVAAVENAVVWVLKVDMFAAIRLRCKLPLADPALVLEWPGCNGDGGNWVRWRRLWKWRRRTAATVLIAVTATAVATTTTATAATTAAAAAAAAATSIAAIGIAAVRAVEAAVLRFLLPASLLSYLVTLWNTLR